MKICPVGAALFHADRRRDGRTDGQTKRHYENNSRFSQFLDHVYNGYWALLHNLNICESVLTKAYGFELLKWQHPVASPQITC